MHLKINSVRFGYIVLLIIGLVLADGVITEASINSGMGWESNPLMSALLPTGHFMFVRFAGSLLVALLLVDIYRHHPKIAIMASLIFVLFNTGIVYWNVAGFLLAMYL